VAISVSDYLRLYKESWVQLQRTSPELSSYEDRTLYSTWQISFSYIKQQNNLSAKLLRFWAYFDSQDLWLELLQHSDSDGPDWVRQLAKDEISFHQTLRVLCDHGLVEVDMTSRELPESRGYSMHRCVHLWTIHVLNQAWDHDLASLAVGFVASHVPEEESVQPWLIQRRLLQHATRCSYIILNSLATDDVMTSGCQGLGWLYLNHGKLAEAEQMYQLALQGNEKAWGPKHTSTLDAFHNLGLLYKRQDRLAEAEQMYQRALRGYEETWGTKHTLTLDTVNNLGNVYANQGKLVEAEQMYQRALQGYEEAFGPKHMSTLDKVNNLGLLYTKQGKLAEAEQMSQRALQGYEDALGTKHMLTLDTVNNVGILYADQGKLVEAEQMYQRALQGYEETLGADNIITYIPALNAIWNLGELSENQADLVTAHALYSKALVGYTKVLGPDHPTTQESQDKIRDLDAIMENRVLVETEESIDSIQGVQPQLVVQKVPSKSKRHKLLRKLGFR
jgi:tetratricopeptide (TPR) repeat protein